MATVSTQWRPPRFPGAAASLRSFRGSSRPTSVVSGQDRRKSISIPFPSLLGFGRASAAKGPQGTTPRSRWSDDKETVPSVPGRRSKEVAANNAPAHQNAADLPQRPRSKSRSIFRKLTTKFRPQSPPPASPPLVNGQRVTGKDARDAALRERGLLPPLRPSRDLSQLELEQDRRIPVLVVQVDGNLVKKVSAANLIKQEWETKNRPKGSLEKERMNNFKFGRSSAPSPVEGHVPPPLELETLKEVDTPVPSPLTPTEAPQVPPSPTRYTPSTKSKRSAPLPALPAEATGPSSPYVQGIELPTTPPLSPTKIPLPPSPPYSKGSRTPRSPEPLGDVDAPTLLLTPPMISLSPPASPISAEDDVLSRHRSNSYPPQSSVSESDSSIATPSLDHSTTTYSSEYSSVGRTKSNTLRVRTQEHGLNNIPMIVESPVEESLLKGSITGMGLVEEAENMPDVHDLSPIEEDQKPPSGLPLPRAKPRGVTDPTSRTAADKRKSINPFKRGQTLDPSDITSGDPPPKRLSMSASLSNMRRSFVGSLSRPKSTLTITTAHPRGAFDASHLPPPSPTPASPSPTSRAFPQLRTSRSVMTGMERGSSPVPASPSPTSRGFPHLRTSRSAVMTPRLAVAPTLHSRETRRMTELAFLG
ncbi:hypothetical protein BD779DRAFT_1494141 [Infundibulicybe gibba]|nr:hypothetical protein BD779DRAFT_1494141 [Infundibulicybe gibba]